MAKAKPRTGEKRKTNQPLKIDRLPASVHEAIQYLYSTCGRTWVQVSEQSALEYNPDWMTKGGGFVNWHDLPLSILELFPDMRLPVTNLHRWYDLRIVQVREATMERAEHARILAEAFAGASVKGDDEAALHAARDIFFGLLSEDGSLASRAATGKALLALAKEQQKARTNDIRERMVAAEERRIAQLEKDAELKRKRFQKEMDAAEKKVANGEALTKADIDKIREKVFGIGPAPVPSNG